MSATSVSVSSNVMPAFFKFLSMYFDTEDTQVSVSQTLPYLFFFLLLLLNKETSVS